MHMLAFTALAIAGPAAQAEQVAPSPASSSSPSSEIIVRGTRDQRSQIKTFVKALTPASARGQLSRFETNVCPVVVGLPDRQNAYIAGRMRRVAEAAGIPVGKPDCDPNAIVIVTNDKPAFLKLLEKERPDYFPASWSRRHLRAIQRDSSPVAAWQTEGMRWADGRIMSQSVFETSSGSSVLAAYPKMTEPVSRMKPLGRRDLQTAVLVVQADALAGLTLAQLADYAAMRSFVRIDPKQARDLNQNTILNVIDTPMGMAVPLTLTAWDLTFLKAFYASGKNNYVHYQRSEIERLMTRSLDRPSVSN